MDETKPSLSRKRLPNLPSVQQMLDAQKVARRLIKTLSALGVEQRTLVTGMVAKHFAPKYENDPRQAYQTNVQAQDAQVRTLEGLSGYIAEQVNCAAAGKVSE